MPFKIDKCHSLVAKALRNIGAVGRYGVYVTNERFGMDIQYFVFR